MKQKGTPQETTPDTPEAKAAALLDALRARQSETNRAGMVRYGINVARAYGVPVSRLRVLARETGRDADTARRLWASAIHEARILACLIHDPAAVSPEELEAMVAAIDSWDLCDQFVNTLARRTPVPRRTARRWILAGPAFVKRAGLSLLACLAVHDKTADEETLEADLRAVAAVCADERRIVAKAASWVFRQIGKRNERLRRAALAQAAGVLDTAKGKAAFAARDAIAELTRPDMAERVAGRAG
ncbi:conserved hypothetical protein [Solidesulfovibrio fructosivorans JJ]]|uniref:DNA alkylation repair enzyme n=1 Tax=Solidesulfovibrio fructosivorans JJ] TaxID=596151 RepID=E1JWT3_SOLFR|nr:DNA alkylation repair protein [Solidesulfovibrio fructosivorans]EFL51137.1 conserved hypothetical protein [Solidesulfovibrio fructosivorans JJ]]